MKKLYLNNFGELPILAKYFWNTNHRNKMITLKNNDIYAKCFIYYKYETTPKFERNTVIQSNLEINYNSHKIYEHCIYYDYNKSKNLYIQYQLKSYELDKNIDQLKYNLSFQNEDRIINNKNFYYSHDITIQKHLLKISKIIKESIDDMKIIKESIDEIKIN
jgi:hypothetical protein